MKTQQSQPRTLYAGHVYHWQRLGLAIIIVAGTLALYGFLPAPAGDLRVHRAEPSIWARAAHNMRSLVSNERADPFARINARPQDPATQSVISYLRVHQVDQPVWEQVSERARYYLQGK